jgi:hypothetical protein
LYESLIVWADTKVGFGTANAVPNGFCNAANPKGTNDGSIAAFDTADATSTLILAELLL